MEHKVWNVQTEGSACVHITINEDVLLTDVELVLLNETRTPIVNHPPTPKAMGWASTHHAQPNGSH